MKIKFGELTTKQIALICKNTGYNCEECIIRDICEDFFTDANAPRFFDLDKEIEI